MPMAAMYWHAFSMARGSSSVWPDADPLLQRDGRAGEALQAIGGKVDLWGNVFIEGMVGDADAVFDYFTFQRRTA